MLKMQKRNKSKSQEIAVFRSKNLLVDTQTDSMIFNGFVWRKNIYNEINNFYILFFLFFKFNQIVMWIVIKNAKI